MVGKCTLFVLCIGMLIGVAPAARVKLVEKLNLKHDLNTTTEKACYWGHEHCCCDVPDKDPANIVCKKFITGIVDGQEACKCGDAIVKEKLGITGHSPSSWNKNVFVYAPWLRIFGDMTPHFEKMESMCTGQPGASTAFVGEQPAGSCTDERLFDLAARNTSEDKIECVSRLRTSTRRNRHRLESSKLMKSFDERITGSSLMGCAKISLGCDKGSLSSRAVTYAISNIKNSTLGAGLKGIIMKKAQEMMQVETGLSLEVSKELLDWAFYHEEGTNPYCNPDTMEDRRDILVQGLTAEEPGHVVKDLPWKYGEEVFGPIKVLLSQTIDGMLDADCDKPAPHATIDEAKEGKGVPMTLSDGDLDKLMKKKDRAVAEEKFLEAAEVKNKIREMTAGNRLAEFAELSPMIKTTLEYLERPVLEHQIEENEARFVRLCMNTLADLLKNEKFMKHLTRFGEIDNWEMPPELDGLWQKTRKAKYFERIWPDSLIPELTNKSLAHPPCDCKDISPALGLHFLNMLPKIGLDFGNNVKLNHEGKLVSDKVTETLEHVDLAGFANTMIMVEAGIADPVFAVKYITKVILAYGEKSASASGLPDVKASGKIKGVLVGMPIVQNLWSALEEAASPEVFAKKMKWFFVANIAWAVWHAIETPLPPEDVILGLLTLAYSTLSSFSYDGEFLVFSNSKEFTEQMLAVYTVWNYRFVQQWASNGQAKDQWMHVSVALTMPLIESLVNHGDVRHYVNYRRDDLFHSMLLMLQNQ